MNSLEAERAYTVEAIAESLGERISAGEFELGTWFRQAKLADEYNVSRTPVALALSRLETLGLVERLANRGFRVRLPTSRDVIEVIEVRALLEGYAAQLAAQRISTAQLAQLATAVAGFREVVDTVERGSVDEDLLRTKWHTANSLFHSTIFDAAGNRQLKASSELLHNRLPRNTSWMAMHGDPRLLAQNAKQHADIAAAIDAGDGDRARRLAASHVETARDIMLARIDQLS
ncbi:GntR family transcriptional regulator [Microbacterium ureisolvens]|uniref:GntR family transcriptional regulator n=1 Tax=Microbacterium ureisolvens TaxID=2781186 RepID=A0ABS7HZ50_9MICO|nr:GntR family transcriptional regulator [Microbacterium ureisolvens]MBW9110676.1 GntR family transcriptional regulator [Microbacterium ureisolvens]